MRIARLIPLLALAALAAPPAAGAAPVALPAVHRTLTASGTTTTPCAAVAPKARRGVGVSTYRALRSGYVSFRLNGRRGDWDLEVFDAASGNRLGASQGFGSREVVQRWAAPGQVFTLVTCHVHGSGRTVPASIEMLATTPPKAPSGPVSLVRVQADRGQLALLDHHGLDVTESQGPGWADVLAAGPAQLSEIARLGLKSTTRIADMAASERRAAQIDSRTTQKRTAAAAAASPIPSGRTTYRTYEDIQAGLKELTQKYKTSVRPVSLGRSFQGRELSGVEIASNVSSKTDGRPIYLLVALHHAREWPSAEAAMEYAIMLARAKSGPLAKLKKTERTVVVPLINPDGFVSSRNASAYDPADNADGGAGSDPLGTGLPPSTLESIAPPGGVATYRRKNCDGAFKDPSTPCEQQYGIDLNRNYGEKWGGAGGSPDTTSQSYHGDSAWSEPETKAVHRWSQRHQVTLVMTLHNVAALVLRPPGLHDGGTAPDEKAMKTIGDQMAKDAGYTSEYSFQLYDTAGTTEDWNYAAQGAFGYTIEIGPPGGAFHEPYQKGFVDEWNGTGGHGATKGEGLRAALITAAQAAANRKHHSVLTGRAPKGVTLRLTKKFRTSTSDYCLMGVDPPVSATGSPICPPGRQHKAYTIPDGLNTTLPVGKSGKFTWDIDPSTRPFVGGGATKVSIGTTPARTDTFKGKAGEAQQGGSVDHPFTVLAGDDVTRIHLTWATKVEDYDLTVFRCKGVCDGAKNRPAGDPADLQVGSSGNPPGTDENVELTKAAAPPGAYYARVTYFVATTGSYTGTISRFKGTTVVTKGHPEPWVLYCEKKGKRLTTRKFFIKRGQKKTLKITCKKAKKKK